MSTFTKYPKIKRLGHRENSGILDEGHLVVQEKLDGANFRFMLETHLNEQFHVEDRDIVCGSRNVAWKNGKDMDGAFEHVVEYVRERVHVGALSVAEDYYGGPLVVFGEAMHPHTLDYNWDEVPPFLGFDVYNSAEDVFLDWKHAEYIIEGIDLPTVPTIYEGPVEETPPDLTWFDDSLDGSSEESSSTEDDADGDIAVPQSAHRDGKAEGIVIHNEDTGQTAKYRSSEFKEKHGSQSPSNSDGYDPSDGEMLARQYTTEARVLKMIHKYEDRGREIEMAIMEDLWRAVFDDIIEEEYDEIFLGNYTINTKQFRSEVASITAAVLQRYLERPDGSVLNEVSEA